LNRTSAHSAGQLKLTRAAYPVVFLQWSASSAPVAGRDRAAHLSKLSP